MTLFITQETFDEVVKENMEDFGMDRKSAAEDAVGQFKAQGGNHAPVPSRDFETTTEPILTYPALLYRFRG